MRKIAQIVIHRPEAGGNPGRKENTAWEKLGAVQVQRSTCGPIVDTRLDNGNLHQNIDRSFSRRRPLFLLFFLKSLVPASEEKKVVAAVIAWPRSAEIIPLLLYNSRKTFHARQPALVYSAIITSRHNRRVLVRRWSQRLFRSPRERRCFLFRLWKIAGVPLHAGSHSPAWIIKQSLIKLLVTGKTDTWKWSAENSSHAEAFSSKISSWLQKPENPGIMTESADPSEAQWHLPG